ncbi:MAG: hypothetical protein OEX12_15060 [Gammaproteobacteria bacterium]|nr:hypothetical protein [Gammaproteobacteria bacterium]
MSAITSCQADLLPASVQELIDVVGMADALKIVEERGGTRLCVPTKAKYDHWLAALIGMDGLKVMVEYYRGEEIEIPRCAAALRSLKELKILAQAADGNTNAQLAREYGYTERGIRKLRRRVEGEQDDSQGDLF